MSNSYVHNCHIKVRDGDGPLFVATRGKVTVRLDRYAVIPLEEWHRLEISEAEIDASLEAVHWRELDHDGNLRLFMRAVLEAAAAERRGEGR